MLTRKVAHAEKAYECPAKGHVIQTLTRTILTPHKHGNYMLGRGAYTC